MRGSEGATEMATEEEDEEERNSAIGSRTSSDRADWTDGASTSSTYLVPAMWTPNIYGARPPTMIAGTICSTSIVYAPN